MKRGTPRHKKMYALAAALKIEHAHAVGIMEMLWHHAAEFAKQGDIGTLDDADIAAAVKWTKKPEQLISALVASGWLHRHEEYRLYIHDWPDHCEQSVKKFLERQKPPKKFLPVYSQCPDNGQTLSGQNPDGVQPSRKAKAMAEAEAEAEGGLEGDAVSPASVLLDAHAPRIALNAFGRPERNPLRTQIEEALINARTRIAAASDPAAYELRIVTDELRAAGVQL